MSHYDFYVGNIQSKIRDTYGAPRVRPLSSFVSISSRSLSARTLRKIPHQSPSGSRVYCMSVADASCRKI